MAERKGEDRATDLEVETMAETGIGVPGGNRQDPAWRLLARSVGSFHAVALTLLLLILSYGSGDLAGQLGSLGSLTGATVFLALWGLGVWTAGRALQGFEPAPRRPADGNPVFVAGFAWGGVYGTLFFLLLIAIILAGRLLPSFLASIAAGGEGPAVVIANLLHDAPGFLAFSAVGGFVAYLIGALIGLIFVLFDLGCWAFARHMADLAIIADRPAQAGPDLET